MTIIAVASIVIAGITTGFGTMGPALAEGKAVAFVGLAMIESTAIYCFVVSMILIFANPFWNHVIAQAAGS
jgi:F-type H+-transporting ATPase subunit c